MENTSKALLIAASVLVVIILVAVGMKIFNSPKEVAQQAEDVGEGISSATDKAVEKFETASKGGNGSSSENDNSSGGGEDTSGLIKFTIDGTIYYAENGMIWESWVKSKYNTTGASIHEFGVLAVNESHAVHDKKYPGIDIDFDESPYEGQELYVDISNSLPI